MDLGNPAGRDLVQPQHGALPDHDVGQVHPCSDTLLGDRSGQDGLAEPVPLRSLPARGAVGDVPRRQAAQLRLQEGRAALQLPGERHAAPDGTLVPATAELVDHPGVPVPELHPKAALHAVPPLRADLLLGVDAHRHELRVTSGLRRTLSSGARPLELGHRRGVHHVVAPPEGRGGPCGELPVGDLVHEAAFPEQAGHQLVVARPELVLRVDQHRHTVRQCVPKSLATISLPFQGVCAIRLAGREGAQIGAAPSSTRHDLLVVIEHEAQLAPACTGVPHCLTE
mmetsp:Transcript_26739/g.73498  ORF Transcript_26739/g.73498 Transcript_26739/m.73498 type:complete len:283 (-) Transcript_26739:976-1824(-)